MVVGFPKSHLPVQSVPITTKVLSLNLTHDEVYSIQHYVIKFVSNFVAGQWYSLGTALSSTNKTDCHDLTEILLKVALNTHNPYNQLGRIHFVSNRKLMHAMINKI